MKKFEISVYMMQDISSQILSYLLAESIFPTTLDKLPQLRVYKQEGQLSNL